jgi:hypothetical protein|tara:strand:+ start:289 stop:504 length:216 start_codon:yes stop_codon:yes gene_type:complete
MKEQTLIEMKNKVQSLTNVVQHLYSEVEYLRTVSFGTLETMKQMSDYDDALGKVKEKVKETSNGDKQQDTK